MAQLDGPKEDGMLLVAPAKASGDLAQTPSSNPPAVFHSAEIAHAAAAVVAASETHSSITEGWSHDKCLGLLNELRICMRGWETRALKAEAKVEQLERDHDKCLDLQNELRARVHGSQARAIKAEFKVVQLELKVGQLEGDLMAQQKARPQPKQSPAETMKEIDESNARMLAELKSLQLYRKAMNAKQQCEMATVD